MVVTSKHWCFTLNNYLPEDEQRLHDLADAECIVYIVWGRETGDSGTPHLQGYAVWSTRVSSNTAKSAISCDDRPAWVTVKKGTPTQASEYCKKDGNFEEYGTLSTKQGKRSDLDELYEQIKAGKTREEIGDTFQGTYIRYKRSIDGLIKEIQSARDPDTDTDVTVHWGVTGTGKTRSVWDQFPHESIYCHGGDRWFDGYEGQEIALFDDFDGGVFKLHYFLRIIDRYPMRVPIKGGFVQWKPKKIFITSNKKPEDWYPNASLEHVEALLRRLTLIKPFFT